MSTPDPSSKKREHILLLVAGALTIIVTIWLLNAFYGNATTILLNRRDKLAEEVERLEQAARSDALKRRLKVYQDRSMPADRFLAASEYQNWLLQLAVENGIRESKIEKASERDVRDGYHSYSFTFRGKTTLAGWARFLRTFHDYDALHLVRTAILKPMKNSEDVDATFTIDAIGIPQSNNKTLVMRRLETNGAAADRHTAMSRTIADRAFFSNARPVRDERPETPRPTSPKFDPAPYTFVCGIVETYGKTQVWIDHRTLGKKDKLERGGTFHVGGMPCVVHAIELNSVTVEAEGGLYKILLGQSFDDAEYLGDAPDKNS